MRKLMRAAGAGVILMTAQAWACELPAGLMEPAAAGAGVVLMAAQAWACELPAGLMEPAAAPWSVTAAAREVTSSSLFVQPNAAAVTAPSIVAWKQNLTNAKGTSPNNTINNYVSQIDADVRSVAYTSTNVYVRAAGIPSHSVGPFNDGPLGERPIPTSSGRSTTARSQPTTWAPDRSPFPAMQRITSCLSPARPWVVVSSCWAACCAAAGHRNKPGSPGPHSLM